jgi:hypothetical protein
VADDRVSSRGVATVSSPDARGGSPAGRFKWVRELGSCAVPTWAALELSAHGKPLLVVVERLSRSGATDDSAMANAVARARSLATLRHANVGRVREVVTAGDEVLVVREFIDGITFRELADAPQRPPLEITIRVLVDVLSGLAGVHGLRAEGGQGASIFHGQLTPDCIFVTPAGGARVVIASRLSVGNRHAKASDPYLAPELLLEDDEADARSDVYGVGVMLWEALSGKSLFGGMQPSAIVTQLLSGRVARATTPADAPWAAPLADVAVRALMPEGSKRFQSAAAMAAEIRRVAAGRVALTGRVAAHVGATYGDVIRKRREELEQGHQAPSKAPIPVVELAASDIVEEPPLSSQSRPTPLVPPPFPPRAPRSQAPSSVEATTATPTAPVAFEPIPNPAPVPPTAFQPVLAPPPAFNPAALEPVASRHDEIAGGPLTSAEAESVPRRPKPYLMFALIGVIGVSVVGMALWLVAPTRDGAHPLAPPPSQERVAISQPVSGPTTAQASASVVAQPARDIAPAPSVSSVASAAADSRSLPEASIESPPSPPPSPPPSAVVAASPVPESAPTAPASPESAHPAPEPIEPSSPPVRSASPTAAPARPKHKYDPEGI